MRDMQQKYSKRVVLECKCVVFEKTETKHKKICILPGKKRP